MPGTAFFEIAMATSASLGDSALGLMLTNLAISSPKVLATQGDSLECSMDHHTGRLVVASISGGALLLPLQS